MYAGNNRDISIRFISNEFRTKTCHIEITDKGYDYNGRTDGSYSIYFDNELLGKSSQKEYEAAMEHLSRLLKENGS